MNQISNRIGQRQYGFTLVELMIAMVLGLVVVAGVISVFIANKQSYRTNEALSQVQDASRTAYEFMARDIRMAGYGVTCSLGSLPINIISKQVDAAGAADFGFLAAGGIRAVVGYTAGAASAVGGVPVKSGTSVITLHYFPSFSGASPHLVGNMLADNANIQINDNSPGFQQGDVLMITDCQTADVFTATNVSSTAGGGVGAKVTIAHAISGSNGNTNNKLSKAYGPDAFVFNLSDYRSVTYFIGDRGANAVPRYSLYRKVNTAAPEELVRGVTDMTAVYHEKNAPDYVAAGAPDATGAGAGVTWDNVDAVQLSFQMESGMVNVTTDGNPLSRKFNATIAIRNRL